jgi:hypothetical protein
MNSTIKITDTYLYLKTVKTVNNFWFSFINTGINPGVNKKRVNVFNRFNGLPKAVVSLSKIIFVFTLIWYNSLLTFSQDCKGTLIINTDRTESIIYLNNEVVGKGNIHTELDAGTYYIIVKEGINNWQDIILSDSVKLKNCNHQTLTFNFDDEIFLQTDPQDAAVFSNDSLIGYTPLHLSNSYSNLELRKPGYESKFIFLKDYEEEKPLTLNFTGKINETSFYEQDLFKYLLAGIVVLGGTTAYFKLKADDKFEEYEITGDQKLLDETERYDLISGITFTALQINFGALIYFFLNE